LISDGYFRTRFRVCQDSPVSGVLDTKGVLHVE